MALFKSNEVVLYKDSENINNQIAELEELEKAARGSIKNDISKQIAYLKRGNYGEDEIMFQLNYADMDMYVLRDVYVELDGISAQIDYYVITSKLHFIIECKNLFGNITINNKGDFVRTYTYGGKEIREGIESPITQNERHMLVLKKRRMLNAGKIKAAIIERNFPGFTKPLVVLANKKTILNDRYAPKNVKDKVIRADSLVKTIKKMCAASNMPKCNKKEMEEQAKYVLSIHQDNGTDYVKPFRELVEKQNSEAEQNICPRCGGKLVQRNGKRGTFIGCSNYPKCRYTENIQKGE